MTLLPFFASFALITIHALHDEPHRVLIGPVTRHEVAVTTKSGFAAQTIGTLIGTPGSVRLAGASVRGPFQGEITSSHDLLISQKFGCPNVTACYSEGGIDVGLAERTCAYNCRIALPRHENGTYYGYLDACGGRDDGEYSFHKGLDCLYTTFRGSRHSSKVAEIMIGGRRKDVQHVVTQGNVRQYRTTQKHGKRDAGTQSDSRCSNGSTPTCSDGSSPASGWTCKFGLPMCADGSVARRGGRRLALARSQSIYGKWEDFSTGLLPDLDACNGQWGKTPDSPDVDVYHYQITDHPPYTVGCRGPNNDRTTVSVQQCRNLYEACSETDDIEVFTVLDKNGQVTQIPYQRYCPCWDKSTRGLDGAGLNVGMVLPYRKWVRRKYMNGNWVTESSGTFAELFGDRVINIQETRQLPSYTSQYSPEISQHMLEFSLEDTEVDRIGRASRRSRGGRYTDVEGRS